jgi:type VI secretion system FHA domain protein
MTLTLHIENETSLPDGGPLSVSIKGKRGLDIGRDPYLDWTLPDPSRFISGRHCEVRWHDGAYWLHDISTNGTFLDGAESRLKAPHRLRNGDRFIIGQYVIAATLEDDVADREPPAALAAPPRHDDLWGGVSDAAMPVDPRQLKAPRDAAPVRPDFLDWAVDRSWVWIAGPWQGRRRRYRGGQLGQGLPPAAGSATGCHACAEPAASRARQSEPAFDRSVGGPVGRRCAGAVSVRRPTAGAGGMVRAAPS